MELKLVMFKPDGQRKDLPIVNPVTVIGRGEDCDLRVPLSSVSRHHCQISVSGEVAKVKDLGSSNGTFVNNKRVKEVQLKPGDRIVVGPIVFTAQINGQPQDVRPAKVRVERRPAPPAAAEAYAVAQAGEESEEDVIAALESLAEEEEENK